MKNLQLNSVRKPGLILCLLLTWAACSSIKKLIVGVKPVIDRLSLSQYEVDPGDTLNVTVTLNEGDEPLDFEWTVDGGQLIAPVDIETVQWRAPALGGLYKVTVRVSNETGSDKTSQNLTVRSYKNPSVQLLAPLDGQYVTQFQHIDIEALARHDNNIRVVNLFINDTLRVTQDGQTGDSYTFKDVLLYTSGTTEIKIAAEARITGAIGSDSLNINVEGIVIGKK